MEAQIYNANLTKKIGDYSTTNEFAELTILITDWRSHLGIKDEITSTDLQMCINHIKELYSEFSVDMVRMAIKSSLKGELKVDIKPYNSFSPMYISTILNSYKSYNDRIISETIRMQRKKELEEKNKPKESTIEEKLIKRLEYLEYYKNNVCNGLLTDYKNIMWEVLTKNNLLKDVKLDNEIIEKEKLKQQNKFLDFSIDDIEKLEKYSIMREFFKINPNFDFTKIEIL